MTDTRSKAAALIISSGALSGVEDQLRQEAARVLEASAADIQTWVSRISTLMLLAAAEQDDAVIQSLKRQVRLLAEIQRVRAADTAWKSFLAVAEAVVSASVSVAVGLLSSGALSLSEDN